MLERLDVFHAEHRRADLVLQACPHRVEFFHALAFELGLRIDLGVADQADALLQMVHRVEMVLPAQVELLQQQAAFHAAHLGAVAGVEGVPQDVAGLLHGDAGQILDAARRC